MLAGMARSLLPVPATHPPVFPTPRCSPVEPLTKLVTLTTKKALAPTLTNVKVCRKPLAGGGAEVEVGAVACHMDVADGYARC